MQRPVRFCFALIIPCALAGCPSRESVGARSLAVLGPGVVNNPANKSLRFDILKFGLDRFCSEMLKRGAPLKLSDDEPVVGRFSADSCQSQVIDEEEHQSFIVQYTGKGYAWTNLTGRIGFTASGLIEYAPDFQLADGVMYVYFRPRKVDATSFQMTLSELPYVQAAAAAAATSPDAVGRQIVTAELQRGFTVIRYDSDGETDYGFGMIPKGTRPFRPFTISGSDKLSLANDRTEVHGGQQDYIGGFEVTDSDQALYLTAKLDGAPALDLFVVPKSIGDAMLGQYVRQAGEAALPSPPLLDETIAQGQLFKRYVPVPKGSYTVVLDNGPAVGRTPSPPNGPAATLDYLVQVGDAP